MEIDYRIRVWKLMKLKWLFSMQSTGRTLDSFKNPKPNVTSIQLELNY